MITSKANTGEVTYISKPAYLQDLLHEKDAYLWFNPKHPAVVMPDDVKEKEEGILLLPLIPPSENIKITDTDVTGTFYFLGKPFFVILPWAAVYFISDKQGLGCVWEEEAPSEFLKDHCKFMRN